MNHSQSASAADQRKNSQPMCPVEVPRGRGIRSPQEGFSESANERHFLSTTASDRLVLVVSPKPLVVEIDCYAVRRELSDYLEDDLTPELRVRIENHLRKCAHCTAIYDGIRNVVQLLGEEKSIDLPTGFSQRLYGRLLRVQ